ncbi:MAG: DUF6599 family protein [bacterium]
MPETAGPWKRPETSQHWDATNLFEYIDGAGELYLGYLFQGLDVYFYTAPGRDDILVELYVMKTPDDAFGLLSTDWGGDPVNLWSQPMKEEADGRVPPQRALYGAGLLRFCVGNLYARVMAYTETPEAKEAVLALGRSIASGRDNPPPPAWINRLPLRLADAWRLVPSRVCFFRSHLILNSAYFLSQQNILNLNHACEAVFALYESPVSPNDSRRIKALLIRYPDSESARKALRRFMEAYLPEHAAEQPGNLSDEFQCVYNIEDGWLAGAVRHNRAAILFECPDQQTAQSMLQHVSGEIQREEDNDDNP